MSDKDQTMCFKAGRFGWNELVTTNTSAAGEFYSKLFGWQTAQFTPPGRPEGMPPYTLFKQDPSDMGVGGMMQTMKPECPSQWVPYVMVENADDSLAKAAALGAKVIVPVMAVGGVGRIAVIQDPTGATIGLHEAPKDKK